MTDRVLETIQDAAASKTALILVPTTASAPVWIDRVVSSSQFQSGLIILGAIASLSIVLINLQSFRQRMKVNKETIRQEKIKTLIIEHKARENNILDK